MDSIIAWDNEDAKLIIEMDSFEDDWIHRKPCKEYLKTGYCKHLESAQHRKFGNRIKAHMSNLSSYVKPRQIAI